MTHSTLDIQQPCIGVGIYVINSKGQLLLGKRKNAFGEGTWSAAGGKLHFGETLEDCAHRELLEETGLHIKTISYMDFTEDIFLENNIHYVTVKFKVTTTSEIPVLKEPHKCEGWHWFDLDQLPHPLFLPVETFFSRPKSRMLLAVDKLKSST